MESLVRQRCLHHSERQAVARCLGCGGFHCRECITEHDGRVMCAACLKKLLKPVAAEDGRRGAWLKSGVRGVAKLGGAVFGLFLLWFFFFLCGKALILIPAEFHEGTVWKMEDQEEDD